MEQITGGYAERRKPGAVRLAVLRTADGVAVRVSVGYGDGCLHMSLAEAMHLAETLRVQVGVGGEVSQAGYKSACKLVERLPEGAERVALDDGDGSEA